MAQVFEIKFIDKNGIRHTTHTTAYWMSDAIRNFTETNGIVEITSCIAL